MNVNTLSISDLLLIIKKSVSPLLLIVTHRVHVQCVHRVKSFLRFTFFDIIVTINKWRWVNEAI